MSSETKSNMEKLGKVFFWVILTGMPLLLFEFSFKGDSGIGFLTWWVLQPWYRIVGIGFIIFISIIVYLLIMYWFKWIFERIWFKIMKSYDNTRFASKKEKLKKEKSNVKDDSEDTEYETPPEYR